MYYTVYKITNQINGKIYIGTHKTEDLNDNYMGSGKYLKYSQEKHGMENFAKEILFVFDNPEDMYDKEADIVNEDFISEENTYNLKVGGFGGWDYVNENITPERRIELCSMGGNTCNIGLENHGKIISNALKEKYKDENVKIRRYGGQQLFKGKKHSEETKKIMSDKAKENSKGQLNSQYGKMWIHSLIENRSTRINKGDPIPDGWIKGRKIKF